MFYGVDADTIVILNAGAEMMRHSIFDCCRNDIVALDNVSAVKDAVASLFAEDY